MAIVMDDLKNLSKEDIANAIKLFESELKNRERDETEIVIKVSTSNDFSVYNINGHMCVFIYVVDGLLPICLKDLTRYCEPIPHVACRIKVREITLGEPVDIKFVKSIPRDKYLNALNHLLVNG